MRSLLLAASLLAAAPVLRAQPAPPAPASAADWRKAGLDADARQALAGSGYRLEDDGRVLDPRTKAALTEAELAAALAELGMGARQLALERLRLLLSKDSLTPADQDAVRALKAGLPDDVVKALDAGAAAAELRRLADQDLSRIAAYFDGARTAQGRLDAAAPVRLGAPGPRAPLPYFDDSERRLGDALRASAAAAIGRDPVGRAVLSRLNGRDGKPDLPPIVVEDAPGGEVAVYDYRRRALVLDRGALRDAVVGAVPAPQRAALRSSLPDRAALAAYLNAHADAVAAFARANDALLVHELTHAWQDRREPVMQEMARGHLPPALAVDYEIEAWTIKNLYVASRLRRDAGAAIDPFELADYESMTADHASWIADLTARYLAAAPNAMDLKTVADLQGQRVARTRSRIVSTTAEQADKSLDLLTETRAERGLNAAVDAEGGRLKSLGRQAAAAAARAPRLLALHYLAAARAAPDAVEAAAALQRAEEFASAAGDAALLAKIRAEEKKPR